MAGYGLRVDRTRKRFSAKRSWVAAAVAPTKTARCDGADVPGRRAERAVGIRRTTTGAGRTPTVAQGSGVAEPRRVGHRESAARDCDARPSTSSDSGRAPGGSSSASVA